MAAVGLWHLAFDQGAPGDAAAGGQARSARLALSETEFVRWHALRSPADRMRFAATRLALRHLLEGQVGVPAASLRLRAGSHGKPYLDLPDAPDFNVSHAGDHALLAIAADGMVGVDIEHIDDALAPDDLREMAAHCCTPREQAWLGTQTACGTRAAFHALWTCKEAVLKALGLGIAEHLLHVTVMPGEVLGACCVVAGEANALASHGPALARMRLCRIAAPEGYAAAMAWVPPA